MFVFIFYFDLNSNKLLSRDIHMHTCITCRNDIMHETHISPGHTSRFTFHYYQYTLIIMFRSLKKVHLSRECKLTTMTHQAKLTVCAFVRSFVLSLLCIFIYFFHLATISILSNEGYSIYMIRITSQCIIS